jgi:trigger factor
MEGIIRLMQVTETFSEGLKRGYSVVIPASDIEARRSKRLAELGRDLRLPGFRPGKVPATMVRQRFGTAVTAEVLETSVNDATEKLIGDRSLRTATRPKVELVTLEPTGDADLEFKVELEVLPEVTVPDFKDIALTRLKAEASGDFADKAIADLAKMRRTLVDVTEDRGAEAGDVLNIDYEGRIDGVPFEGGKAEGADIDVAGDGFIPGFSEQMIGMKPGEERTIVVSFPADYHAAQLAGKEAQFALKAHKIQRAELPQLDDAYAEILGFENLEELRGFFIRQKQRELDNLSRLHLKRELLDILAGRATFEAPETLVEPEFARIWGQFEEARKEGKLDAGEAAKDEETNRADYRKIAERRVRVGLLLGETASANGLNVTQDELLRAMRMEAQRYRGQEQQVMEFFRNNPEAVHGLRAPILEDKVVDYVLELATVEDKVVTPEELKAAYEAMSDKV